MTPILNTPYRKWFLWALAILVITSFFSVGYHNHDEHFQILEFCNYKMGLSSANDLPWEFPSRIRPAVQPFIAYCFAQPLNTIGLYDPFVLAFLLRLMMAVLSWWAMCRLILMLLPDFNTQRGKNLFVLCSFFIWFVPYVSVRFSAENFAAVLFCFALSLLLQIDKNTSGRHIGKLLLAGILLGFAWFSRVQLGFAYIGLLAWILFIRKWPFRTWFLLGLSTAVAIGLNVVIDYWLYAEWVFTPYNYFDVNILHDKAASFGETPFWGYFNLFIMNGVPPLSIVLLLLYFRGTWKQPLHLFSILCITFFLGHFLIGHKEMRFLYPLMFPFIYLVAVGIESLIEKVPGKKVYNIGFKILVFMNIGLLLYKAFTPAQETVSYYKFMYKKAKENKVTLLCIGESPYTQVTLPVNFYKHKNLEIQVVDAPENLPAAIDNIQNDRQTYLYNPRMIDMSILGDHSAERVYSSLPDWLLKFNFNNWQERTRIGTIYKVD